MEITSHQRKHFVLVHGACHGAWCWYKLKPRLESAGHRVTAIDLSASGTNYMKNIEEVHTLHDYALPLLEFMESIPAGEKVILVGHSLGGFSLALAMDMFPEKVSVGVFVTALMPDSLHLPFYVVEKFNERNSAESWMDTQFSDYGDADNPSISLIFGPKYLSSKLYTNCTSEDIALGTMLIRTGTLFKKDLSKAQKFSAEGYGSGKRIYVVCDEDLTITEEFQRWMIENNPVMEVKVIKGADHMPMLSKPEELCRCLLDIAATYP